MFGEHYTLHILHCNTAAVGHSGSSRDRVYVILAQAAHSLEVRPPETVRQDCRGDHSQSGYITEGLLRGNQNRHPPASRCNMPEAEADCDPCHLGCSKTSDMRGQCTQGLSDYC